MKYPLESKPGPLPLVLYGLQWWVVSLPCIAVAGLLAARLHHAGIDGQVFYLQKLFALAGALMLAQTLFGHRLPLVAGPATVLLVGMAAAGGADTDAVYTATLTGGAFLAVASAFGALTRLRSLFTPRIVAVVLILIAMTLSPLIVRLIFAGTGAPVFNAAFATALVFIMLVCNAKLPSVWKSLTVFFGAFGGSAAYFFLSGSFDPPALGEAGSGPFFISGLRFDPGLLLSFLFCFMALAVNELGSIEAVGHLVGAGGMPERVRRGAFLQGLANVAAGGLGVIGSVDLSLSSGIIAATGCASRYVFLPAGGALVLCALFPKAVLLLACMPGAVMGSLLLYLMAAQIAGGLGVLARDKGVADFSGGVTVGLPLLLGLLVAFAPAGSFDALPPMLRPLINNGFVMGALAVALLEHAVFRKKEGGA